MKHPLPSPRALRKDCPVCGGSHLLTSIVLEALPAFCNVLYPDPAAARGAQSGHFVATFCCHCNHLFNAAFDEYRIGYTQSYENSLHFSARFTAFSDALARRLNSTYALAGKTIVDIGCGKGDFLNRLCLVSGAAGVGFDKSFQESRVESVAAVRFVKDWFGDTYAYLRPDFVSCRHVIEHITEPVDFLRALRANPGVDTDTVFYFEAPNALYTLRDLGIWDLIYEHVSYFTPSSLRVAFEIAGYEVLDMGTTYGEQYLYIEAKLGPIRPISPLTDVDVASYVKRFSGAYNDKVENWQNYLATHDSGRVIVWGAGSKGVTFVNVVPGGDQISALVDVNPYKQGRYAPGSGTPVVSPKDLSEHPIDTIIIMNPLYLDEISDTAKSFGCDADILVA